MISGRFASPAFFLLVLFTTAFGVSPRYVEAQAPNGSDPIKSEARNVSGFHSIALGVPARLTLRQSDSEGLSIIGERNIVPLVQTVVESGVLKIRWATKDRMISTNHRDLEILVNAKNIDAVAIYGSGEIHAARLKTGQLHTAIEGSGGITLDAVEADSITSSIHGNGRLTVAGRAEAIDVALAGSGELSAEKLDCRRAKVAIQGSAHATVWARDDLNVTIAGSGEVNYYGKPQLSRTIAGSGSVRWAGEAS